MTQNQIRYQEHLETKRNNVAVLDETKRANLAREAELNRHNLATEQYGWATLDESRRHNYASESIGYFQAGEQARHNYATEGIQSAYNAGQLEEGHRHNVVSERNERQRNAQNYSASIYKTQMDSATSRANAQTAAESQQAVAATNAQASKDVAEINKQSRWETTTAGMFTKLLKSGSLPSDFMLSIPLSY